MIYVACLCSAVLNNNNNKIGPPFTAFSISPSAPGQRAWHSRGDGISFSRDFFQLPCEEVHCELKCSILFSSVEAVLSPNKAYKITRNIFPEMWTKLLLLSGS